MFTIAFFSENGVSQALSSVEVQFVILHYFAALLILRTETKELKRRVRDVIDPKRDLGHVDGKKSECSF